MQYESHISDDPDEIVLLRLNRLKSSKLCESRCALGRRRPETSMVSYRRNKESST